MNIEEKAKAYDDIIQRVTELYETKTVLTREQMEYLFPELRESEDERIRKAIIHLLEVEEEEYLIETTGFKKEQFLSYLEKQKEQKQEVISISEMVSKYKNTDEYDDDGNYKGKPVNCMIRAYEQGIRDTLSKVKEQKPADDKAFEEWIDDWWKHNKVNNPDSYDKGDEIQFDERGFKNFCRGIRNMYQQMPVEWSEEDEEMMMKIDCYLSSAIGVSEEERQNIEKWLKSLRPS